MGLINDLFARLFRNGNVRWENERKRRLKDTEQDLKIWMVPFIKERGDMPFSWESGNDEAFVTFSDSKESDADNFQYLEEYIVEKLNIPDAGEFQMTGSGRIYISNNVVRAEYSSTMKGIIDYDEENDREIYSEEELDNDDVILFIIE